MSDEPRFTPAEVAVLLREAAAAPEGRLSGHSGVSVRYLRALADKVEEARGALGTVRRTAPRTLYDQGYQDGQTDERAVIVAALDAALRGDR